MIEKFKTKRDINGNVYTLVINHYAKTYTLDYNPFDLSDYILIGKRERNKMTKALEANGYNRIF